MIKKINNRIDGVTQKETEAVLEALSEVIVDTLKNDKNEKITLPGLGVFSVKHVAERSGVAALAGNKARTKPAHDKITFQIKNSLKEI